MIGQHYGFRGYEYLVQIFIDMWPQVVVVKRAQIGATEAMARRDAIFSLIYQGVKIIYTFPTADDMKLYVKDRFDDLIRESPILSQSVQGNPDSVMMKKFNTSSIIFRGRSSERSAISIPANRITHDEADFSEQEIMETFRSRLGAARLKITREQYNIIRAFEEYSNKRAKEVDPKAADFNLIRAERQEKTYLIEGGLETRFSTPTIPGFGVSRLYWGDMESEGSDQMELWIRHPRCGTWQQPIFGPESIEGYWEYGDREPPGKKYYRCLGCKKPFDMARIGLWDAQKPHEYEHMAWVPKHKTNSWRGYRLPWYTAAQHKSARDLMLEYHGYKLKSKRDNFFLGLPSMESNDALNMELLNQLHSPDYDWEEVPDGVSEYVMGADQGAYRIVAKRIPHTATEINPLGKIAIIKVAFTPNEFAFPSLTRGTMHDKGEMARDVEMFGISVAAIDNLPNETSARQLVDLYPGRIWRVTSSGTMRADLTWDDEAMTATESKIKALDKAIKYVRDGSLILPRSETPSCLEFKKHCCNMIKVTTEKADSMGRPTGNMEIIYNKVGPEHYLHALKFLIEAMELNYLMPPPDRVAYPKIDTLQMRQ